MEAPISIIVPSYNEPTEFVDLDAGTAVSVLRVQGSTLVSIPYL